MKTQGCVRCMGSCVLVRALGPPDSLFCFFFTFLFLHLSYAVCILLFFICNVGMLFCWRVGKGGVLKRSVLYAGVFRKTFDFKYVLGDP